MSSRIQLPLILILFLIAFPQISETIYTPALPDVAESLGCTAGAAEETLSVFLLGFAIGIYILGWFCDKIGRRPTMLWALGLYIIGCIACTFSSSIEALLLSRFIQALGAAAGSIVVQTMLRDCYTGKELTKAYAFVGMAVALSPAIGPTIGGFVDQYFSWSANFTVLSILGFMLFVSCYFLLPETRPQHALTGRSPYLQLIKRMAHDRNVISYILLVGLANSIIFSYYAEGPFLSIEILGLSPSEYGLLGIVLGASSFAGSFLSRQLTNWLSSHAIILIGTLLSSIGSILLAAAALQGLVTANSPIMGLAILNTSMAFCFVGIWLIVPPSLSLALRDYQADLGRGGAIVGCLYTFIFSVGTAVMSAIHNATPLPMPLYFSAISLGALTIAFMQYSHHKETSMSTT